jgi:hypothetical protein
MGQFAPWQKQYGRAQAQAKALAFTHLSICSFAPPTGSGFPASPRRAHEPDPREPDPDSDSVILEHWYLAPLLN